MPCCSSRKHISSAIVETKEEFQDLEQKHHRQCIEYKSLRDKQEPVVWLEREIGTLLWVRSSRIKASSRAARQDLHMRDEASTRGHSLL